MPSAPSTSTPLEASARFLRSVEFCARRDRRGVQAGFCRLSRARFSASAWVSTASSRIAFTLVATVRAETLPLQMKTNRSSGPDTPNSTATLRRARTVRGVEMPRPTLRSSRASWSRPAAESSALVIRLKYERIFWRAPGVFTMLSQSRLGFALFCVMISTRSPIWSS